MPKRALGQHFLADPRILDRIADLLEAAAGDRVLEIGPGRGGLTRALVARGVRLTAIERDRDLVPPLRAAFPTVAIVEGDALDLDWPAQVGASPGEPWLAIGNIPYNITSPLIEKALQPPAPARIVFLVQREVADRLTAPAGGRSYGALTVGVAVAALVERLLPVLAGSFHPRPKVDSAVVRLTPRAPPLVAPAEMPRFRRFVGGLFAARRKQMARALRTSLGIDAGAAADVLASLGIDPTRRPEALDVPELVALYRRLVDEGQVNALAL